MPSCAKCSCPLIPTSIFIMMTQTEPPATPRPISGCRSYRMPSSPLRVSKIDLNVRFDGWSYYNHHATAFNRIFSP